MKAEVAKTVRMADKISQRLMYCLEIAQKTQKMFTAMILNSEKQTNSHIWEAGCTLYLEFILKEWLIDYLRVID